MRHRLPLLLVGLLTASPALADATAGITIAGGPAPLVMDADAIAKLPAVSVTAAGHGGSPSAFEGPLLWTLLLQAHAVDTANPHGQGRESVLITGSDGFVAVLGLGEISPEFEGKSVILADQRDGQPLGAGHLRIVVPGDKRGGRGVHDVVSIAVQTAGPAKQ